MNFDRVRTRIGPLELPVNEDTIAVATGIPRQGEKWFKYCKFKLAWCDDFLKPEFKGANVSKGIPSFCLTEQHENLMKIIQRYFTY